MTRPPREALANLLFADDATAKELTPSSSAWPEIFKLAEIWSVVPQLAERLTTLAIVPPAEPWQAFKRLHIATFARTASRASRGVSALRQLTSHGIAALAFKGVASMARLYQTPASRTIKDADILIDPNSLLPALASLAEFGFHAVDGFDPARLEKFMEKSPGFSGNKAIVLADATGFELDLHWSVGRRNLSAAALIGRSEVASLFGSEFPIVSVADGLLLTARHAIRENLSIDTMCRDLLDIRLTCKRFGSTGDPASILAAVSSIGSLLPFTALVSILGSLNPADVAVQQVLDLLYARATKKDELAVRNLRELFFQQLAKEPFGKDLFYLSHTRPLRQIAAGALSNWREYRYFMRSMEEKLDGKPQPIGRRLLDLAIAAKRAGPGSLRRLRTLSRLKHGEGD